MDSRNDKQEWSIGALLTFEVQMLDLSPMDLFGMLDKQYQEASLPSLLSRHGLNMKLSYIGQPHQETEEADPGYRIQKLTAQAKIVVESTTEDSHVQPGQLDVLFIPGPPPDQKHGQQTLGFVRAHAAYGTTILTVCTGCYVAAQAGILDGRKASGPRALVSGLQRDYPKVSWDDNRRFVKDVKSDGKTSRGEIWSSGKSLPGDRTWCKSTADCGVRKVGSPMAKRWSLLSSKRHSRER